MSFKVLLEYEIVDDRVGDVIPLPEYSTDGSAGLDLRACLSDPFSLKPDACELIKTGIAIYLGSSHLAGLIIPRSGLGHRSGLILGNAVGLIDSDYQGELFISCWNRSQKTYTISPGERIAQLVVVPVMQVSLKQVVEFKQTKRGNHGFGSSGKQ